MRSGDRGDGAGLVPRTLHYSFTTLNSLGRDGSHTSRKANAANGKVVTVPLYRHEVAIDYTRVELELLYTATVNWDVIMRLPWERRAQHATFSPVEAASAENVASMRRAMLLHHPVGVLTGMSDVALLARRRFRSVFRDGDGFALAVGVSLPTGSTVENPYTLSADGTEHEHSHIQFGSGTVDPTFESSYVAPARGALLLGAFVSGRLPLYENSKTFKSAPDGAIALFATRPVYNRFSVRAEVITSVQGYGYWDGVRDKNMTGLVTTTGGIGASVAIGRATLSIDGRYPIGQRTFAEGDTFKRGPTVIVGVSGRAH